MPDDASMLAISDMQVSTKGKALQPYRGVLFVFVSLNPRAILIWPDSNFSDFMQDILLTPHFKLSEFINSPTAKARGIDNTLNPSVDEHRRIIANLTRICQEILEPLRTYANSISPHKQGEPEEVPITISSGYRCPQLNAAVGGVKNSQHMTGEAVDIGSASSPTAIKELRSWMEFIINETDFDQCILEHTKSGVYWIHVSCKSNPALNRHHAISFLLKN